MIAQNVVRFSVPHKSISAVVHSDGRKFSEYVGTVAEKLW
jgi:hypothetical protein